MGNRSPFRVGDAVTLHTSQNGAQTLLTVKRFDNDGRCMVLSDGTEWRADGKKLFRTGGAYYRGPWLEPTTEADIAHVARRRAVGAIRKFAGKLHMDAAIPTPALLQIMEILKAHPLEEPAGEELAGEELGTENPLPGETAESSHFQGGSPETEIDLK